MKPFICFVHIGKCGGTTFNSILSDNLPGFYTIPSHRKARVAFNKDHLRQFLRSTDAQGVGGHTVKPYLDYESVVRRQIFYVTFLRDPVKRYISLANHRIYRGWSKGIEDTFAAEKYRDYQIRHLTGNHDLNGAIEMIQRLDFVGIVEQYDLSLLLLKQKLEPYFDLEINYERENVAKDRRTNFYNLDTLSEVELNRVKTENALDVQLYQKAWEQFEQMKADYKGDLDADLEAFRDENHRYNRRKSRYYFYKAKNALVKRVLQPLIVS